ncbi:MAG: hypothetical protein U0269_05365 [Polyangiales bacterium]
MNTPRYVTEACETHGLTARVRTRAPLLYTEGARPSEDLPAHVRAGSAMALTAKRIAVVQDDTNSVAIVDRATGAVSAVLLPRGEGGARQFGEDRKNKKHKLDLEACVLVQERNTVLAFGSGSTAARERVLVLTDLDGEPTVRIAHGKALYAAMRADKSFSGSELNIEGVARVGDSLRFFQRGNGAPLDGIEPIDATADVRLDAVLRALDDPGASVSLERVRRVKLGTIDGVRLTFTDAWSDGDEPVWFLAAAEASPDTYHDGEVRGSAIGWIDGAGDGYWCTIIDERGQPFRDKAEGLALDPANPDRAWIVVDKDDPKAPCELCELILRR